MAYRIRGVVLPERVERTFWVEGSRISTEEVPGAETVVDGGWLVPGLVDAHTHPGAESPEDPFDEAMLRDHLLAHRDAGVLLVRTPGSVERIPGWVDEDPEMPRVQSAGRWLATAGHFFPGYPLRFGLDELAAAAVEEAKASSGWCKVIGDWMPDDEAVPLEVLRAVTGAVHAVGGKVAVHATTAEGSRNAVLAGVDSLEHGRYLDPDLLDQMAAQGTALVPTLTVAAQGAARVRAAPPSARRDWWLAGWDAMPALIRSAHEAGVTVLAGTDSLPFGNIAAEIAHLRQAGLSPEAALGSASWTARAWLGMPGLVHGAPADLVAYDADPVTTPEVLADPVCIMLRGQIVKR
ncbi:MAG TPA: amidohydrolase family protein [Actinocrinis sp.]|nr:amidohydrolase family protein [Actinocrinis sp.]